MLKNRACCFTGHRQIPVEKSDYIKIKLYREIEKLIQKGIIYYYVGGAIGFDTIAAQAILYFKKKYPQIKLIMAIPCATQTALWSKHNIDIYNTIKEQCDKTIYISQKYTKECMLRRNRYMVENSSFCICYQVKSTGGTAYTVNYARQKGLQIINI